MQLKDEIGSAPEFRDVMMSFNMELKEINI